MDTDLKSEVKNLFQRAATLIKRKQFWQEPNYTAAFFGKLNGELVKFEGTNIEFTFSITDDRGPKSAESVSGIDIGLIITWIDGDKEMRKKAVLMQAKNHLYEYSHKDLDEQCKKMSEISDSYVVMDCPYDNSIPTICQRNSASQPPPFWDRNTKMDLVDYLLDVVLECQDGDTDPKVLEIAENSNRCLRVKTNGPVPELTEKNKNDEEKNKNDEKKNKNDEKKKKNRNNMR